MPTGPEPAEAPSLETALARLEAIVREMEGGTLPLETLIARFEEGVALAKTCQSRLDHAESRVQLIARTADGSLSLEDFPTTPDE